MSLVNYSSSEDSDENVEHELIINNKSTLVNDQIKGSNKIPLPNEIKTRNGININQGPLDDSNQHDGRKRSFPHERGNWATFLSIPYDADGDSIAGLQSEIINAVQTKLELTLHPIETLHISLSKTVALKFHWIQSFVKSLQNIGFDSKKFIIELDHLNVYCNEDKTRTFISIGVCDANCDQLKILVNSIDQCFNEFNLSTFYQNPSFHVSILWCLGDQQDIIRTNILDDLQMILNHAICNDLEDFQISVHNVKCKIGKQIYNLPLT